MQFTLPSLWFVNTAQTGNLAVSKTELVLLHLITSIPWHMTTIPLSLNFVLKHSQRWKYIKHLSVHWALPFRDSEPYTLMETEKLLGCIWMTWKIAAPACFSANYMLVISQKSKEANHSIQVTTSKQPNATHRSTLEDTWLNAFVASKFHTASKTYITLLCILGMPRTCSWICTLQ